MDAEGRDATAARCGARQRGLAGRRADSGFKCACADMREHCKPSLSRAANPRRRHDVFAQKTQSDTSVSAALRRSTEADVRTCKGTKPYLRNGGEQQGSVRARTSIVRSTSMGALRRGRVVEMGIDMGWVVRLGREEWQRFTYERPEGSPLQLLGSVAQGAGIGALAVDEDGNYLQVNGDHVSPIKQRPAAPSRRSSQDIQLDSGAAHPTGTLSRARRSGQTQATGSFRRRCEDRSCLVAVTRPSQRAAVATQSQKRPVARAGRRSCDVQSFLLRDQIRWCAPSSPSTRRA
jgi:hypothetical protein